MKYKTLLAFGVSFCALAASPASAQDGSQDSNRADEAAMPGDGVILVTARRREESALTVPISITAISADALQARGIERTDDLQFAVPSLRIAPQISPTTPNFVIRGQGRGLFRGALPSVVTYFADVPIPQDGSFVPLFDLQSVQVLKGPQGTLFGRNTTGGAILLTPTKPNTIKTEGFIDAGIGNYDARNLTAAVNVPLVEDLLAVRLVADIVRRDGFVKNLTGRAALGSRHSDSFRISFLVNPTDAIENLTIFDYSKIDETGTPIVPTGVFTDAAGNPLGTAANAANAPYFFGGTYANDLRLQVADVHQRGGVLAANPGVPGYYRSESWGITNTTTVELGDITLKNIFGYRRAKVFSQYDIDGVPLSLNDQFNADGLFPQVAVRTVTNEFQVLGELFDKRLEFVAGAFILDEGPTGESGTVARQNFRTGSPAPVVQNGYVNDKSKALFLQGTYHFGGGLEGLNFTAGYRHTWDERTFCVFTQAQSTKPDQCSAVERETSFNASGYTFSLDYRVTNQAMLYATTRRGYRGGGVNTSIPANLIQGNFAPETVTDYEGGIKSAWDLGGMSGRFNFAYFRANISDFQASAVAALPLPGGGTLNSSIVANAARAHNEGYEVEFAITPFQGFALTANYDHFIGKFDEFIGPPGFPAGSLLSYQFNTPKYTLNINGRYTLALPTQLGESLSLSGNFYRRSQTMISNTHGTPNQYNIEPAFNVIDLRLDWKRMVDTNLDVGAFIKNVGDTRYRVGMSNSAPVFTLASSYYGDPRTYGIELRYTF